MSNVFVSKEILELDILSVTLRNHNKRNALSDSIKLELEKIALELRDKTEIKAVILSGEKGNMKEVQKVDVVVERRTLSLHSTFLHG